MTATLATLAVALADSSSLLQQDAGVGGQAQKEVPLSPQAAVHTSATLPFTGLDRALMVAEAIVLVLTGWLIYRAGRVKV